MTLPPITAANQGRALAIGYGIFVALYLGSAALPAGARVVLEPTALDRAIPFAAWTIWIYLAQFLLLPAAIVCARDDGERSRTFYAMLLATAIAAIVFVLWPTQLDRPAAPSEGLTGIAWTLLYMSDTSGNCLPSLHVALASLAGMALWRRGWRTHALIWPLLIGIAALTTKQHVAWDLLAGLVLAVLVVLAWILTPKLVRNDEPQRPATDAARA
jgi:membrane-associated phospholipid phosphatase